MIVSALAGKLLPVYGDGQQIRDWLYVTITVALSVMYWQQDRLARSIISVAGMKN